MGFSGQFSYETLVQVIGTFAVALIFVSMIFKTNSFVGTILMRAFGIAGATFLFIYGCMMPAIVLAVISAGLIIVNIVHLCIAVKNKKKTSNDSLDQTK